MATFHIHQDEKENTDMLGDKRNVQIAKDKRTTFTVLNNNSRAQQGKTAFRELKSNIPNAGGKIKNENAFNTARVAPLQKKTISTTSNTNCTNVSAAYNQQTTAPVSVEQFKYFTVFEDKPSTKEIKTNKKSNLDESNNSSINNSRDPLRDITLRDDILETPMSVSDDLISPMSIDKSSISQIIDKSIDEKENIKSEEPKQQRIRNDRERFFEVIEYQMNILEYFREIEKKNRPKSTYMQRQPDINYSMRTILVDWLVEVSEEYRLHTETLYLAISYIDRFLSYMSVVRAKLQLVGTSAMFIAAKYEEIYPPDVSEFVFITDDTYTKSQVLRMEQIMLKILSFDLCSPSSYVFLNTYAVLHEMPNEIKFLAMYFSELALLEGDPYLQYVPSMISSAALALARHTLKQQMWNSELEKITSYQLKDLKEIILHLNRSHEAAGNLAQQAIQEKYKQNKYLEVATIKPVELNLENIDILLAEQQKLIDLQKSLQDTDVTEDGAVGGTEEIDLAPSNNESVRKMISSLMFV